MAAMWSLSLSGKWQAPVTLNGFPEGGLLAGSGAEPGDLEITKVRNVLWVAHRG